ncbi:hypothetical protein QWY93_12725 [Echinicola jeungdonensis]|uniref:Nuclear transport factor 2 family protein n=1 Tax=Echinicola jeungdonensis TaxID=709343 RepID=A0ABV5J9E5_9BACT|nr:hypothetical protein [Echinicola jeungdonensis]MDN3670189.1 hypothetical protein [Echinicola jeungdonensis]
MIKSLILPLFLLVSYTGSQAQQTSLDQAAQEYSKAQLSEDVETLIDFTYPYVLQKSGGKEALRNALVDIIDFQKSTGVELKEIKMGKAKKITKSNGEIHALIPVKSILDVPGGKLISENTLIAVSNENSGKWYFIDASVIDETNIHQYLPTWNGSISLFPKGSDEFVAKQSERAISPHL